MRWRAAATALALAAGCASGAAGTAGGCDLSDGAHTVDMGGERRRYDVSVSDPDGPVVLLLHGVHSTAATFSEEVALADVGGGVVVAPDTADKGQAWDRSRYGPDLPFLERLAACADGDVHAVGFSAGGMMAARLACDGVVDSAVVVGGMIDQPCDDPAPTLVIHGEADDVIGWDGAISESASYLTGYRQGPTVPELAERWGADLEAHDGGHWWPDGASHRVWSFVGEVRRR